MSEGPVLLSAPFMISKITLLPGDTVQAPLGDVLHVDFAGQAAFAWVKHHPEEKAIINLASLPTGGPFSLETDSGFKQPVHVGSFAKKGNVMVTKGMNQPVASVWHVFAWYPVEGSATYGGYPSLLLQ